MRGEAGDQELSCKDSTFEPTDLVVLSKSTQTEDERWFRKEWAQACDRARAYFGTDRGLIFPVVIDATANNDLQELRREIFGRTAVRAPGGEAPPELIANLDAAQKAWRKQNRRT